MMLFVTTFNGFQILSHKDFHPRCSKVPGASSENIFNREITLRITYLAEIIFSLQNHGVGKTEGMIININNNNLQQIPKFENEYV